MTKIELQFYETIIKELPKVRKSLMGIASQLSIMQEQEQQEQEYINNVPDYEDENFPTKEVLDSDVEALNKAEAIHRSALKRRTRIEEGLDHKGQ